MYHFVFMQHYSVSYHCPQFERFLSYNIPISTHEEFTPTSLIHHHHPTPTNMCALLHQMAIQPPTQRSRVFHIIINSKICLNAYLEIEN
jgi:hypothetical protein